MSVGFSKDGLRRRATRLVVGAAAAGTAAAAYMVFESQWVRCRQAELPVPGLPHAWSGVSVLHLSDVHAGLFPTNEHSLRKVVSWAAPLTPDLVFLTGDILGDPLRSRPCVRLLAQLRPRLGMFAVTGNHEYGLARGPFARPRDTRGLWDEARVTLLSDECIELAAHDGSQLVVCGADHISGGQGLLDGPAVPTAAVTVRPGEWEGGAQIGGPSDIFPVLLIHRPPSSSSILASRFALVFAGHTHGGQLRVPSLTGLRPVHHEDHEYWDGTHPWGAGSIVISRGVGGSFLPFRLFTRPEATLWRLVYTSPRSTAAADHPTQTGGIHG